MKKFLLLAALVFAGLKLYQGGYLGGSSQGAFDAQGKPVVVLFVGPGCDDPCQKVRNVLRERKVSFQEIDVAGPDGAPVPNKYGIRNFPTTLIGDQQVLGDDLLRINSVLAETYGKVMLSRKESRVLDKHFDANGNAEVVMYATQWCGYCKQQREFFAANGIPYREIDVEASEANLFLYNSLEGRGYPLTYVGYRRFSGYQEHEILAAIKERKKADPRH
jgi:glutaredoxin